MGKYYICMPRCLESLLKKVFVFLLLFLNLIIFNFEDWLCICTS